MALTEKTNSTCITTDTPNSTHISIPEYVQTYPNPITIVPFTGSPTYTYMEDLETLQYRVSEKKEGKNYLFLVPEVKSEDITVMIENNILKVTVSKTENYSFLRGRKAEIYLPDSVDMKRIVSYIERGILTVDVYYKQESLIHIEEK